MGRWLASLMKSSPSASTTSGPGSMTTEGIPALCRRCRSASTRASGPPADKVAGTEEAEITPGHRRDDDGQIELAVAEDVGVGG